MQFYMKNSSENIFHTSTQTFLLRLVSVRENIIKTITMAHLQRLVYRFGLSANLWDGVSALKCFQE